MNRFPCGPCTGHPAFDIGWEILWLLLGGLEDIHEAFAEERVKDGPSKTTQS